MSHLAQASICELYGKAKATISEHISNIFAEGEQVENSVVRFYRTTADDGKRYNEKYFNLSMILAIGYRVRSVRGTHFVSKMRAFQYRNRAFFNLGKTPTKTIFPTKNQS